MTGIETALMMLSIMSGSLIRETPPCARMSAGTRSRAMTATAPASSAILAWSGVTTSMITPPLSISAMPRLTRAVPIAGLLSDMVNGLLIASGGAGFASREAGYGRSVLSPGGPADGQSTPRWPALCQQLRDLGEELLGVRDHLVQHPVAGE